MRKSDENRSAFASYTLNCSLTYTVAANSLANDLQVENDPRQANLGVNARLLNLSLRASLSPATILFVRLQLRLRASGWL